MVFRLYSRSVFYVRSISYVFGISCSKQGEKQVGCVDLSMDTKHLKDLLVLFRRNGFGNP